MDPMIQVDHLVKRYKKAAIAAVDDISFEVGAGELFARPRPEHLLRRQGRGRVHGPPQPLAGPRGDRRVLPRVHDRRDVPVRAGRSQPLIARVGGVAPAAA
jgi:hypothetical protein